MYIGNFRTSLVSTGRRNDCTLIRSAMKAISPDRGKHECYQRTNVLVSGMFLYSGLCRIALPEPVPESVDGALAPLDTLEPKVFSRNRCGRLT